MAPIVVEVLRTARQRGGIDAQTSSTLVQQVEALAQGGCTPSALPDAGTVAVVAEVLDAHRR